MNKMRTLFTPLLEPRIPPRQCIQCKIYYPNKRRYFHRRHSSWYEGWCCYCVAEKFAPHQQIHYDPNTPPNEAKGEQKCGVCSRNFIYHPHNFNLKYHHPSGLSPCCRLCEAQERREFWRKVTEKYLKRKTDDEAIAAAFKRGQETGDMSEWQYLYARQEAEDINADLDELHRQQTIRYARYEEELKQLTGGKEDNDPKPDDTGQDETNPEQFETCGNRGNQRFDSISEGI